MTRTLLILSGMAWALAGCGTTTPVALDAQMGASVEMARAQQTLNPQASLDTRPVEMIDGKSADALLDRYHKGFEKPPVINIFNLGVSEGGGSTLGTSTGTGAR